jgi:L-lactate dehydrogenase
MVPIWSSASINGLALDQFPGFSPVVQKEIFEETKGSGAKIIKLKGGAGFAVGVAIRDVVHAIAQDYRQILPVSSLQMGKYGLRDVCLSVPTIVGCGGVREQIELPLSPHEKAGLWRSAQVLRETIDAVEKRIGSSAPATVASSKTNSMRAIPRVAWQMQKSK